MSRVRRHSDNRNRGPSELQRPAAVGEVNLLLQLFRGRRTDITWLAAKKYVRVDTRVARASNCADIVLGPPPTQIPAKSVSASPSRSTSSLGRLIEDDDPQGRSTRSQYRFGETISRR